MMEMKDVIKNGTAAKAEDDAICVGDLVSLVTTATYYDGRIIPCWIKKDKWYVSKINGNRVVIDRNESGTHSICSPVNRKYLMKER